MNLGIYETKTDFCIISPIDFLLLDMFVGMCENRGCSICNNKIRGKYRQQMVLSAIPAVSSSYGNTLPGLGAQQSRRWHRRRVRSRVRSAQEPAKLQYRKLGDSDLLISEITLGTVCAQLNHHVSVVFTFFLHNNSLIFTSFR